MRPTDLPTALPRKGGGSSGGGGGGGGSGGGGGGDGDADDVSMEWRPALLHVLSVEEHVDLAMLR